MELVENERLLAEGRQQLAKYQENRRLEMVQHQQRERADLEGRIRSRKETLEAVVRLPRPDV